MGIRQSTRGLCDGYVHRVKYPRENKKSKKKLSKSYHSFTATKREAKLEAIGCTRTFGTKMLPRRASLTSGESKLSPWRKSSQRCLIFRKTFDWRRRNPRTKGRSVRDGSEGRLGKLFFPGFNGPFARRLVGPVSPKIVSLKHTSFLISRLENISQLFDDFGSRDEGNFFFRCVLSLAGCKSFISLHSARY